MTAAAIFFGTVLALWVNGLYHFGAAYNLRMRLASRLEQRISNALDIIADNPIRWSLRAFFVAYVVGGVTFSLIEPNASVFDGLWWAYISMMTVGYGDLSPKTWIVRTEALVVILIGIASVQIMTSALTGRIAERRIRTEVVDETPELHDNFAGLCMELDDLKARFMALGHELKLREMKGK